MTPHTSNSQVFLEKPNYVSLYSKINSQRYINETGNNYFYYKLLPEGSIINNIYGHTYINRQFNLDVFLEITLNKDNERLKANPLNLNEFFVENLKDRLKENNCSYFPCNFNKSFKVFKLKEGDDEPLFINQSTDSGHPYIQLTNRHYYDDEPQIKTFYPNKNGTNLNDFRSFADYIDFILENGRLTIQSLLERYKSNETIKIEVFDSNLSWAPKNNIFPSINA